jgi:hypothetical protein
LIPLSLVIPSRGRPQNVDAISKLFPTAWWCISKEEAAAYKTPRKLIHPNSLFGLAAKRQWILDKVGGVVVQLDDDITGLWCNVGERGHLIVGAKAIHQIIENAAECAVGMGAPVFGFNQAWDVRKYNVFDPFATAGWVGTAIGFVGREIQYDTKLTAQADIDFCLRAMLKKRTVWIDRRFSFMCQRFVNTGGSAGIRTSADFWSQVDRIKDRWGKWLTVKKAKGTVRIGTAVKRRQELDL